MKYYPEGSNPSLEARLESIEQVRKCIDEKTVLESRVLLCDKEHNLHLDLGVVSGIIPRNEGALGIDDGSVRDIALISKVNKLVCFRIISLEQDAYGNRVAILSRRSVQKSCADEYLSKLKCGDIIDATVTHLEKFGVFIDIGAGINALIPIDMLSVSRINHPRQRLYQGQKIKTVLRKIEPEKLTFSLKELLGTWQENADKFTPGETVRGIVRSVESYGVFVELAPNLSGLAEVQSNLVAGQQVAVYVKSILPDKMKIKLVIVEAFEELAPTDELEYYISDGNIDVWNYSPPASKKQITTEFSKR